MAEYAEDVQKARDILRMQCEVSSLDTNASKTKVMMSSRGNIKNCKKSILMRERLVLLGITNIGKLIIITSLKTHKCYCFHLQTGLLSMLSKCRQINLPRDIEQIELLENVCTQHFYCGSEIWAYKNLL